MAEKSSNSGNPFFDAWWAGSERLMQAQSNWFSNLPFSPSSLNMNDVIDDAKLSWEKCEEQFQAWVSASSEWLKTDTEADPQEKYSDSFEALKSMLSPAAFFHSGVSEFDHIFQRLADGPDFADFGVYEKKLLRINQDWQAVQKASIQYQTVIAQTWAEAFNAFTQQVSAQENKHDLQPKELLQQWLATANHLLTDMQRSELFLEAQNKLVETHTQFRVHQKEFTEHWCEAMVIPSRSEVDDLHQIVYQLRREVRDLKRELDAQRPADQALDKTEKDNPQKKQTKPKVKVARNKPKTTKTTAKKTTVKKTAASEKKKSPSRSKRTNKTTQNEVLT